jgi:hypothetical protein
MHIINGCRGTLYQAAAHPDFAKLRPCHCFVPEQFISGSGLLKTAYLASRWPGINCGANVNAIGSHILPDMNHPISPDCECPELAEFLRQLRQAADIKSPSRHTP